MTLDFIFKTCTGHDTAYWAERGDLDWFNIYANGDDAGKGVLIANWNHFPHHDSVGWHETPTVAQQFNWNRGRKFQDLLERAGYHLEWSDQTSRCSHCNGCIAEGPDYYGDSAHYAILGECDLVCEACIRKDFVEEYLEGLENNPRAAVAIRGIDPASHGYAPVETGFENGLHPGQNDRPADIFKRLKDKYPRILFAIDSSGQFDARFSVWRAL
jgi:hypothetical protein